MKKIIAVIAVMLGISFLAYAKMNQKSATQEASKAKNETVQKVAVSDENATAGQKNVSDATTMINTDQATKSSANNSDEAQTQDNTITSKTDNSESDVKPDNINNNISAQEN